MNVSLKPVFRHLWNQRLFTTLNVIGLAIGISSCWMIYGIVKHEYSYDKPLPDRADIYRLTSGFIFDEKESFNAGVSKPMYMALREEVPSLKKVVPTFGRWINSVQVPAQHGRSLVDVAEAEAVYEVDSSYFDLVPYKWLAGNPATAMRAPEALVLTASRAKVYFAGVDPRDIVGRTVVYNDTISKTVSGVVADLDFATDFDGQEFFSLLPKAYRLAEWTNTNGSDRLYLQLASGVDTAKAMKQITAITDRKTKEFYQSQKVSYTFTRWFQLHSLEDFHFASQINDGRSRKASKTIMFGLIALAGFILLLACINYINLTTAQIPQRSKEIAVRKTLGSGRANLIFQLLVETVLTVAMASLLALFIARLGFRLLTDIIPQGSEKYGMSAGVLLAFIVLVMFVSALSGGYPAWLMAKVQPLAIMRGKAAWNGPAKTFSPRKMLIVLQFVIAQVFIVGALIMGAQMKYTITKDLGFNKNAVVLVDVPWKIQRKDAYKEKQFPLANELAKISGIEKIALGDKPLEAGYSSSHYTYTPPVGEKIERQVFRKEVDTAWAGLYGLQLLAGRNLMQSDTTNEYVINETAMRAFGFKTPQDALGKVFGQEGSMFPIVGVVKDFHLQNFHTSIDPMALMSNRDDLSTLNIKLSGNDPKQWNKTIKEIESKWNLFYPVGSFSYQYYDETLENMYKEERNMSMLVNLATIISILISCLGLFGLATLTALQRTKEIGIRKVLGSSVSGIVGLLSTDFVKLILIALVIAIPISWWAMDKWLTDFAYRVPIQWWMFAVAGLAAIIIAMITIGYQSIRAAMANPVKALRNE
ncbi:MAG: FtsX-like permease family protein [Chitinophagaceae bacterium]|nr:MAG: FtsX-like permease family protein [Chitinophagaceae bacterium]